MGHRRDFMVGCLLAAAAAVLSCKVQPPAQKVRYPSLLVAEACSRLRVVPLSLSFGPLSSTISVTRPPGSKAA